MKTSILVCTLAATLGSFSTGAFAQHDDGRRFQPQPQYRVQDRRDVRDDRRELREAQRDAREARRDLRDARRELQASRYDARVRRGAYIPRDYRARAYVVNDWRGHRLSAPPANHQWVQVGADYALIAVATGLIAHLVMH
jgi:Ni/Co efflux regulator RcnB